MFFTSSSLVKSNDDVEYGIGLIEEIVRGARDWENVGNRKLEIIRENIAKRLMERDEMLENWNKNEVKKAKSKQNEIEKKES